MKITKIPVGILQANCYILNINNNILIIDPGAEGRKIEKLIDGKVIGILITHSHPDHTGSVKYLKNVYNPKVFNKNNLNEGDNSIGPFNFEVIYTPGHKDDLITFYFKDENIMFTGDFIFNGSIGRFDFEDSNINDMKKSINKILLYENNIKIYPGHGDITTLGEEREMLEYYAKNIC